MSGMKREIRIGDKITWVEGKNIRGGNVSNIEMKFNDARLVTEPLYMVLYEGSYIYVFKSEVIDIGWNWLEDLCSI